MLELYHFDAHQSDWIEGFSFKFCCFSQYPSRTLFEDATAELVGDLIWDEEYRLKWDDMLVHFATLEDCPTTRTMVVQWM
jgi:hypothetical protein